MPNNDDDDAGIVPTQWKTAIISLIPKVANPQQPSDFRPISVTPVLSRMLERLVVCHHIYPAIMHLPPGLCFTDQYAFRPTGSTTAAIIALLYTVRSMLTENLYVHVFALDFSEAFDTIPLSTLMDQMSNLPLHDNILQLDCQFFCKAINTALNFCRICVRYCDWCGKCHPRSDCLGPACYIVAASDLQASHTRNVIIKFADDTYLIVPAANSATCPR